VGENQVDVRARNIFGEYGPVATRRVYRLETPFVKGDVNQDGVVNVADVTLMSLFLDQIAELPDPTLADMDGNGKIGKPDLDLLVDQIVN
jgi:hypothetical protein